jgi:hypothetical protein
MMTFQPVPEVDADEIEARMDALAEQAQARAAARAEVTA